MAFSKFALSILLLAATNLSYSQWSLTGNTGTVAGTNFIGTTDNNHLDLRTNNIHRARLDNAGKFNLNFTENQSVTDAFSLTNSNHAFKWLSVSGTSSATTLSLRPNNPAFNNDALRITAGYSVTLETFAYADMIHKGYYGLDLYGGYGAGTTKYIRFFPGGALAASFTGGGNLLLNTTTDNNNKLQVNGNIWSTGLVLPTGAAAGKVLTSDANGNATWQTAAAGSAGWSFDGNTVGVLKKIGTTDNYDLPIITNNVERLRVSANGNVGIGTTQIGTDYKLYVEGNIRARRVKVDAATWPDFVFHPSYTLRPLEEVKRFIDAHHHLPDVPSAAEVKEKGLDVSDTQAILLQKIEELTLYIIEQNNKQAQMEKRLAELEKERGNKAK